MTPSPARPGPRPARAALVRRAAVPAVVLGVLGGAAGVALASQVPASYTAASTILLNPLDGNPFHPGGSGEDLINLTTEAEVVRSDAVASLVAQDLGEADVAGQLSGVSVHVLPNTQILEIEVSGRSATGAVERAGSFADAYLEYRIQRATRSTDVEREQIQQEISERNAQLQDLADQYAAAEDDPPKAALISAQIQTTTTQLTQLNARLVDSTSDILDPGQVVTVAAVQPAGLLSVARLLPLLGVAGGVALAVLGAWWWGRRDRVLRHVAQVEDLVPALVVESAGPGPAWTAPVTDDYRAVRSRLPGLLADARPVLLSLGLGAHAPGHVAPLALATAAAGMRTVVVDLTGELLTAEEQRGEGLAGLLVAASDPAPALVTVAPGVSVLPPGVALAAVGDLVAGARFDALVDVLLREHDLVVVVARSGGTTAERSAVRHATAALVEVRLGTTRTSALQQTLADATALGAERTAAVTVATTHRHTRRGRAGTREPEGQATSASASASAESAPGAAEPAPAARAGADEGATGTTSGTTPGPEPRDDHVPDEPAGDSATDSPADSPANSATSEIDEAREVDADQADATADTTDDTTEHEPDHEVADQAHDEATRDPGDPDARAGSLVPRQAPPAERAEGTAPADRSTGDGTVAEVRR